MVDRDDAGSTEVSGGAPGDAGPTGSGPSPRVARRRRLARAVLAFALSAGICLLAFEAVFRAHVWGAVGFSPARMNSMHSIGYSGLLTASRHPELRYELLPNRKGWFKLVPFETSSAGLRDREYAREKPAGTLRVAAIGDSFTMGEGVRIEDVYHSVLERELPEELGRPVEVLNFGVAGYELSQSVAAIRLRALDWDPDLVLVALNYFDLDPPLRDPATVPFVAHPKADAFFELHGLAFVLRALSGTAAAEEPDDTDRLEVRLAALQELRDAGLTDSTAAAKDASVNWRTMQNMRREYVARTFGDLASLSEEHGVPIVVVFLTTTAGPAFRQRAATISEACAIYGLPFVDTTDLFEGTVRSDFTILKTDVHPNARANRMYARVVRERLRELGLLAR